MNIELNYADVFELLTTAQQKQIQEKATSKMLAAIEKTDFSLDKREVRSAFTDWFNSVFMDDPLSCLSRKQQVATEKRFAAKINNFIGSL